MGALLTSFTTSAIGIFVYIQLTFYELVFFLYLISDLRPISFVWKEDWSRLKKKPFPINLVKLD